MLHDNPFINLSHQLHVVKWIVNFTTFFLWTVNDFTWKVLRITIKLKKYLSHKINKLALWAYFAHTQKFINAWHEAEMIKCFFKGQRTIGRSDNWARTIERRGQSGAKGQSGVEDNRALKENRAPKSGQSGAVLKFKRKCTRTIE